MERVQLQPGPAAGMPSSLCRHAGQGSPTSELEAGGGGSGGSRGSSRPTRTRYSPRFAFAVTSASLFCTVLLSPRLPTMLRQEPGEMVN